MSEDMRRDLFVRKRRTAFSSLSAILGDQAFDSVATHWISESTHEERAVRRSVVILQIGSKGADGVGSEGCDPLFATFAVASNVAAAAMELDVGDPKVSDLRDAQAGLDRE